MPSATTFLKKGEGRKVQGPFLRKREVVGECQWMSVPCGFLISIAQYACSSLYEVYKLSRVCSVWRQQMCSEQGMFFWNELKGAEEVETFP